MKITITKDTIILIGLLYNYLSNYELELYEWRIKSFIDEVSKKLEKENIDIEITEEYIEKQNNEVNKYLEKDLEQKTYKIINICNIDYWYKKLPKELINITLKNDILPTIYSENLKLLVPVKKEYITYKETKIIISNDKFKVEQNLIDSLKKENIRNIKIEAITKTDNDLEYYITYSFDKVLESLDMQQILQKRIKKKKEVLELLFEKRRNLMKQLEPNHNEIIELNKAIEKLKIQLYGKNINNNQKNNNDKKSKELIDLASKYHEVFEIKPIEIPENLTEKFKPLEELQKKKIIESVEQNDKKTKKRKK